MEESNRSNRIEKKKFSWRWSSCDITMFCLVIYLRFVAVLSVFANFMVNQWFCENAEYINVEKVKEFEFGENDSGGKFISEFCGVTDQYREYTNAIAHRSIDCSDPAIVRAQCPKSNLHVLNAASINQEVTTPVTDRIKYTRHELLELRNGHHEINRNVIEIIKTIPKRSRSRGRRGDLILNGGLKCILVQIESTKILPVIMKYNALSINRTYAIFQDQMTITKWKVSHTTFHQYFYAIPGH